MKILVTYNEELEESFDEVSCILEFKEIVFLDGTRIRIPGSAIVTPVDWETQGAPF